MCVFSSVGGLCLWNPIGQDAWQQSETFEIYRDSVYKECDGGLPGSLVWTVAEDTPDLVYYQASGPALWCLLRSTHRLLHRRNQHGITRLGHL